VLVTALKAGKAEKGIPKTGEPTGIQARGWKVARDVETTVEPHQVPRAGAPGSGVAAGGCRGQRMPV